MVINTINIIKCPRCNSTNYTCVAESFYKCNQCGNSYHYNVGSCNGGFIHSTNSNPKNSLLVVVIIVFALVSLLGYLGFYIFNESSKLDTHDTVTAILNENRNEKPNVNLSIVPAYARTAFILYKDKENHCSYLFKADFLTTNGDTDDQHAVKIKKIDHEFIGYDALTDKVIANFNQFLNAPLSFDASIVYVDNDNLIIKNKITDDYQLEMLDAYTGDIIWTLSNKELPDIEKLTGKYSAEENRGIVLDNDGFMLKLPPNYYLINKEGQIIDFGLIN